MAEDTDKPMGENTGRKILLGSRSNEERDDDISKMEQAFTNAAPTAREQIKRSQFFTGWGSQEEREEITREYNKFIRETFGEERREFVPAPEQEVAPIGGDPPSALQEQVDALRGEIGALVSQLVNSRKANAEGKRANDRIDGLRASGFNQKDPLHANGVDTFNIHGGYNGPFAAWSATDAGGDSKEVEVDAGYATFNNLTAAFTKESIDVSAYTDSTVYVYIELDGTSVELATTLFVTNNRQNLVEYEVDEIIDVVIATADTDSAGKVKRVEQELFGNIGGSGSGGGSGIDNWYFKYEATGEVLNTDYKVQEQPPTGEDFGLHAGAFWNAVGTLESGSHVIKHYQICLPVTNPTG